MKCNVCNATLTDYESSLRHGLSNKFLDLCMVCVKEIGSIPVKGNSDLMTEADATMVDSLLDDDDDYLMDDSYDADMDDYWNER